MFNIFNKRKKLEEENKLLKDTIYNQEEEIKSLNDKISYCEYKYKDIKDSQQETINTLLEQNKNMTEWIYKILKELGTVNTDNKHINIPICTNSSIYKMNDLDFVEKEYIEIPSITLIKQRIIQ